MKYDLLLKGGRVVDYKNDMDKKLDVGIKDASILEVGEDLNPNYSNQTIDVKDKIVVPGIIDTHVHILREDSLASGYRMLLKAGVTTAMDFQGPVEVLAREINEFGI